jgi:hypothetical protein
LQALLYVMLLAGVAVYMVAWLVFSKAYLEKAQADIGLSVWTAASRNHTHTGTRFSTGADGLCGCTVNGASDLCQSYNSDVPRWGQFINFSCVSLPSEYTRIDAAEVFIPVALRVRSRFRNAIGWPGCSLSVMGSQQQPSYQARQSLAEQQSNMLRSCKNRHSAHFSIDFRKLPLWALLGTPKATAQKHSRAVTFPTTKGLHAGIPPRSTG